MCMSEETFRRDFALIIGKRAEEKGCSGCMAVCLARDGLWERETERLYERYLAGEKMEKLADEVCRTLLKIRMDLEKKRVGSFTCVKDRLFLHVEMGRKEEGYPSRQFYDMRIRYRIRMDEENSVLLNDHLLEKYDLLEEELYGCALKNCMKRFPVWMKEMQDGMVMARAEGLLHGAGVMFFPNFRKEAEERMQGGYYVLPSSVHEVLLLPEERRPFRMDLSDLVRRVNEACVEGKDRLSEMAYHVEKDTGRMLSVKEYDKVAEEACPFLLE